MSTVKISDLPEITHLDNNTANTILLGVDTDSDVTAKFTVTTLAEGLFHNNSLKVGEEPITFSNTIAQFKSSGTPFLQVNLQNADGNSSADYVATADIGTNANNFIDVGINGSTFSDPDYSAMQALDGYLFVQGSLDNSTNGNLIIGTASSGANVVIAPGGTTTENVVAHFTKTGLVFQNSANLQFTDGSIQTVAAAPASLSQGAYNTANSASSNTVLIQGVNVTQNNNITAVNGYAVSAYAKANSALANTTGTFNGNLTFTGNVSTQTITAQNSIVFLDGSSLGYNPSASPATIMFSTANNLIIETNDAASGFSFNSLGFSSGQGITSSGNTNLLSYVNIIKSDADANTPVVQITSNEQGTSFASSNSHYILQLTGKQNTASRLVIDSFGQNSYPIIVGRMARGTIETPLATANNDVLMRIVGNGYTGTQFTPSSPAKIDFVASENYSDANKGSTIQFWNTPTGSNVIQRIASFNANEIEFTGSVKPEKGFIYTPRVLPGSQTAITIDFANNSIVKASLTADLTISFSNYTAGKIVELWLTNTGGTGRTVTHGCSATNSSENATTFTIPSTSSAYLRYFSIDGDLANTFVSSMHA